jgi:putative oxidoreductase
MKTLSSLGRFLYAIPFLVFGVFHFLNASQMAQWMPSFWPVAEGLVYIAGLGLLLAGISIILNIKARLASLLLALLLLIIIVGIHIPSLGSGDQMVLTSLLKDTSLMGAALTYSGILKK